MRVQSHDRFAGFGDFNPDTRQLRECDGAAAPPGLLAQPLAGHYAWIGGVLAVLFREGGSLRFALGEGIHEVKGSFAVEWRRRGPRAVLTISDGGELTSVEYQTALATYPLAETDPTPFVESEHFDFGLFVRNVVADADRAARIYPDAQ
jgi:hypothetical protein